MPSLNLAYDLVNKTPADANPVQSNFQRLEQFANTELINRDGTVAMTGQLRLVGDPQNALDAATKQYVDLILPIGVMFPYPAPGSAPGAGTWALANGAQLAQVDYPDLFAKYKNSWGGTPASGFFNLPNMADRVPVGAGGSFGDVGATGGSKDSVVISHVHNANHGHSASSDIRSTNHVHGMNNHQHYNNTDAQGQHGHGMGHGALLFTQQDNGWYAGTGDVGALGSGYALYPHYLDGNHAHHFWSDGPNIPYTAWQSDGQPGWGAENHQHAHGVTVNGNNFDTAPTGVAGTNQNMQPYAVVNWIVRVK